MTIPRIDMLEELLQRTKVLRRAHKEYLRTRTAMSFEDKYNAEIQVDAIINRIEAPYERTVNRDSV